MPTKQIVRKEPATAAKKSEPTTFLAPPVTIYENDSGLTLHADLPGVSKERVRVEVEHDRLRLEAELSVELADNMRAVHAELRNAHYRREFTVSSELDTQSIEAEMKDGVLTLHISKKPSARPKKIEVK